MTDSGDGTEAIVLGNRYELGGILVKTAGIAEPLRFPWPSWRASRWTSRPTRRSRIDSIGWLRGTSYEQR